MDNKRESFRQVSIIYTNLNEPDQKELKCKSRVKVINWWKMYSQWTLNELSTISIAFFLHRNCEFLIDFTQRYFISSVTMHTIKTWKKELLVSKIWLLERTCSSDKLAVVKRAPCNSSLQLKIDLAKAKSESLSSTLKNCLVKKKLCEPAFTWKP